MVVSLLVILLVILIVSIYTNNIQLNIISQFFFQTKKKDDNLNAIIPKGSKGNYGYYAAGDKHVKHNTNLLKASTGLFNAPSIIPVHNPAIRVYKYQIKNGKYPVGTITDWNQYYVDLDKANSEGKVKFELEYTASKLFGVNHFDGKGVGQAIINLAKNKKNRKLYKKYAKVSVDN